MIVYEEFMSKNENVFLTPRFEKRILSHIVSNYLDYSNYFHPPLYLLIEGDAGEGKTIQVIHSCICNSIPIIYLSSSELSSGLEGNSKKCLIDAYEKANELLLSHYYVAIIIDDFHLGNANRNKNMAFTVNSDVLISHMMNLADNYRERIPIILTGNDFSSIYYPLIRDGRADFYEWKPTNEEKAEILYHILKDFVENESDDNITTFINLFINQSISFFSQIRNDARYKLIEDVLNKEDDIGLLTPDILSEEIKMKYKSERVSLEQLYKLANTRVGNNKKANDYKFLQIKKKL